MSKLKGIWAQFHFGSFEQCVRVLGRAACFFCTMLISIIIFPLALIAIVLLLSFSANIAFHSSRNVAYRSISPDASVCADRLPSGWDVLADAGNDEWRVIEQDATTSWKKKLACSIQRHVVRNYKTPHNVAAPLVYDLAFIELQEDGQPYILTSEDGKAWVDQEQGQPTGQLDALLRHLDSAGPQFVVAFIHGWRHDASIGDGNVGDLRVYAAHAARFLADRCDLGDIRYCNANVTGVFIGWRGARSNELWLTRNLGTVGAWLADFTAVFTLFDRKPISEAVAPSALAALRAIQDVLGLSRPLLPNGLPPASPNKMLVLGHSLGGNMLAVALKDQVVKDVLRHEPGTYMPPPLGDLVVLINPASEAANWTAIQRAVWDRIPMAIAEKASLVDFAGGHNFFPSDQRPVLISVTAARDWPPGGLRPVDCAWLQGPGAKTRVLESRALGGEDIDYDSATYDAFPTFKGDLRPIASSIIRRASHLTNRAAQVDPCQPPVTRNMLQLAAAGIAAGLRVLPFMNTDVEQTRTIGHLDPPRAPRGTIRHNYYSGRPFGTTHEARGVGFNPARAVRRVRTTSSGLEVEASLSYAEITSPEAACPQAANWLTRARGSDLTSRTFWDSEEPQIAKQSDTEGLPSLQFIHGFETAGLAATLAFCPLKARTILSVHPANTDGGTKPGGLLLL